MPVPHIPASRYAAELKKDARDMRFPHEIGALIQVA